MFCIFCRKPSVTSWTKTLICYYIFTCHSNALALHSLSLEVVPSSLLKPSTTVIIFLHFLITRPFKERHVASYRVLFIFKRICNHSLFHLINHIRNIMDCSKWSFYLYVILYKYLIIWLYITPLNMSFPVRTHVTLQLLFCSIFLSDIFIIIRNIYFWSLTWNGCFWNFNSVGVLPVVVWGVAR